MNEMVYLNVIYFENQNIKKMKTTTNNFETV